MFSKIYHITKGYWKGYEAINKLANAAKVSEDTARKWLEKQSLWQIYLPAPKYIPRPHWVVNEPNYIHQADLLFLPSDNKNKYALVIVDIATRYLDAEPLTIKYSSKAAKAFKKIYSRKKALKFPHTSIVDPGKEFMGDVTTLMNKHSVHIQRSEAKNHREKSIVERANRTLSEKLFSHQYAQEC